MNQAPISALAQGMDGLCTQNPWAITAVLLCIAVQQFLFFRALVHALSEGARPTQGLIIVSRVRTQDMARSFDSGEGSSVSDSVG